MGHLYPGRRLAAELASAQVVHWAIALPDSPLRLHWVAYCLAGRPSSVAAVVAAFASDTSFVAVVAFAVAEAGLVEDTLGSVAWHLIAYGAVSWDFERGLMIDPLEV